MASDLDPALIEAVALGLNAEEALWSGVNVWTNDEHGITDDAKDEYRRLAVAAIRAVDAFRAASVRAAVEDFGQAAMAYTNGACEYSDFDESRTALLKIVGAQEEPS